MAGKHEEMVTVRDKNLNQKKKGQDGESLANTREGVLEKLRSMEWKRNWLESMETPRHCEVPVLHSLPQKKNVSEEYFGGTRKERQVKEKRQKSGNVLSLKDLKELKVEDKETKSPPCKNNNEPFWDKGSTPTLNVWKQKRGVDLFSKSDDSVIQLNLYDNMSEEEVLKQVLQESIRSVTEDIKRREEYKIYSDDEPYERPASTKHTFIPPPPVADEDWNGEIEDSGCVTDKSADLCDSYIQEKDIPVSTSEVTNHVDSTVCNTIENDAKESNQEESMCNSVYDTQFRNNRSSTRKDGYSKSNTWKRNEYQENGFARSRKSDWSKSYRDGAKSQYSNSHESFDEQRYKSNNSTKDRYKNQGRNDFQRDGHYSKPNNIYKNRQYYNKENYSRGDNFRDSETVSKYENRRYENKKPYPDHKYRQLNNETCWNNDKFRSYKDKKVMYNHSDENKECFRKRSDDYADSSISHHGQNVDKHTEMSSDHNTHAKNFDNGCKYEEEENWDDEVGTASTLVEQISLKQSDELYCDTGDSTESLVHLNMGHSEIASKYSQNHVSEKSCISIHSDQESSTDKQGENKECKNQEKVDKSTENSSLPPINFNKSAKIKTLPNSLRNEMVEGSSEVPTKRVIKKVYQDNEVWEEVCSSTIALDMLQNEQRDCLMQSKLHSSSKVTANDKNVNVTKRTEEHSKPVKFIPELHNNVQHSENTVTGSNIHNHTAESQVCVKDVKQPLCYKSSDPKPCNVEITDSDPSANFEIPTCSNNELNSHLSYFNPADYQNMSNYSYDRQILSSDTNFSQQALPHLFQVGDVQNSQCGDTVLPKQVNSEVANFPQGCFSVPPPNVQILTNSEYNNSGYDIPPPPGINSQLVNSQITSGMFHSFPNPHLHSILQYLSHSQQFSSPPPNTNLPTYQFQNLLPNSQNIQNLQTPSMFYSALYHPAHLHQISSSLNQMESGPLSCNTFGDPLKQTNPDIMNAYLMQSYLQQGINPELLRMSGLVANPTSVYRNQMQETTSCYQIPPSFCQTIQTSNLPSQQGTMNYIHPKEMPSVYPQSYQKPRHGSIHDNYNPVPKGRGISRFNN